MLVPELEKQAALGVYGAVERDAPMSALSKWRIGGKCALLVEPETPDQAARFVRDFSESESPYIVIGATSNLLFDDAGFPGACLRLGRNMSGIAIEGNEVTVLAGTWVPIVARKTANAGLSGLEHIVGIPGSIGGLITMNGGSQRRSISEYLESVQSITINGEQKFRGRRECDFSYRDSIFRQNSEIILKARFRLDSDDQRSIRSRMLQTLRDRRRKFPLKEPNCGSVFVSNPAMYDTIGPPGKVIESLGLKGYAIGGAMVSERHANFFVNTGDSSSSDMLQLIKYVKSEVLEKTGFELRTEVLFVASNGDMVPADQAEP